MKAPTQPPEILELDAQRAAEIVRRAEASGFPPEEVSLLRAAFASLSYLMVLLTQKNISLARLKKLVFGARTEKTEAVLGGAAPDAASPSAGEGGASAASPSAPPSDAPRKRRKGHGRNGAEAYRGAVRIPVPHESLEPGDACPECPAGTVYELARPATLIRIVGQAPVQATIYELQRLRCNLCGDVFTAQLPEGVSPDKYDVTVASMIGLLKYGSGMPFNRFEGLQADLGIPLPAGTQWELVRDAAEKLTPAQQELIRQAAQGEVVYNDDTNNRILALMGKRLAKAEAQKAALAAQSGEEGPSPGKDDSERRGIFTSGIVSTCAGRRIALFFTGRKHAGDNLRDVLAQRAEQLAPPIQMCDALSRNMPAELNTILANCLAHGRRQFVDVAEHFPDECRQVLEALKVIYHNDAVARRDGLSPEARLQFHKAESGPVMDDLHTWLTRQIEDRLVEPNSGLGAAIAYLLKHWPKLTLFLRQAGAPLDNNVCERALKKVILHRKNAMFYLTENGARVGDLYMSLIYTCELCGVNPFDYLTELQRHARELAANPADWMPWNYRQTLTAVPAATGPPATATSDNSAAVP
jgi:hypothetical protein